MCAEPMVVGSKDMRSNEMRCPTVAHWNDNVKEFHLSDANILSEDFSAYHDGSTEHECVGNGNCGTQSANMIDADDAMVDDMGKDEDDQTNKISVE